MVITSHLSHLSSKVAGTARSRVGRSQRWSMEKLEAGVEEGVLNSSSRVWESPAMERINVFSLKKLDIYFSGLGGNDLHRKTSESCSMNQYEGILIFGIPNGCVSKLGNLQICRKWCTLSRETVGFQTPHILETHLNL